MAARTWLAAACVAVMAGALAGKPARTPPTLTERLTLTPQSQARFGIDEPFTLTLPIGLPAATVARSVTAPFPVRVTRLSAVRYHILPRGFWPGERAIHLRLRLEQLGPQWPWPAPALQATLHTGAAVAVDVSLTTQEMAVYQGDQLLRVIPVSTGSWPRFVTPTGRFYIFRRVRVETMSGGTPGTADYYRVQQVPYSQYIFGGVAIHGAWWSNAFGVPRSHGCIQLPTQTHNPNPEGVQEEAGWLWSVTSLGTPVTVTGSTPHVVTTPIRYPAGR